MNGGRNAGCDSTGSNGHTYTVYCEIVVEGVGLSVAQRIFYLGFTSLQANANICDARNSTVASTGRYRLGISAAWAAVGVREGCTPAPPLPPCGDPEATIPFESEHPYRNSTDCTWTCDHGSPGYALHFSVLDVERSFDFITVPDANGAEIASYKGTFRRGVTTPCMDTSVANVRLATDGSIVGEGFVVDAVVPCG